MEHQPLFTKHHAFTLLKLLLLGITAIAVPMPPSVSVPQLNEHNGITLNSSDINALALERSVSGPDGVNNDGIDDILIGSIL